MSLSDTLTDVRMRTMNVAHRTVLAVSGGRIGHRMGNMPVFKVTTTGRASGRPRSVMLTSPVRDGDSYVFVASKGGDDRDPDWYRNLVTTPEITVEPADGGDTVELLARTASSAEKADLWPRVVEAYGGYGGYQNKTDRDIPVVIAEPPA